MRLRKQIFVNFFIRTILGAGLIFLANQFFAQKGIDVKVGFNAISVLVSGTLGIPGVAMLYGIVAIPIL